MPGRLPGMEGVVGSGYIQPGELRILEPGVIRVIGATYLDNAKDAVTLDVRFSFLQDGTGYPATQVLVAKAKNLSVNITNAGYRKSAR